MSLPKANRLKKKKDFDRVFKKGKAVNGSFLFVKSLPNSLSSSRFGFIVAAKFAPKAVTRNKVRRLLSDVVWPRALLRMRAYDNVVVVTRKVPENLTELKVDFSETLKKAHLS